MSSISIDSPAVLLPTLGLPLALARNRVEQMAISAKPRPSSGGFQDRGQ